MTIGTSSAPVCVDDDAFDAISASHLPWALDLGDDRAPVSTRWDLGDPWVVGCRIGRMTGRRGRAELRSTPGEYVAVLLVHRGTEYLSQEGRTAEVTAGGAALWDGVRPVECFTASRLDKHTMFVPRALLAEAVPDLDAALVRAIPDSADLRLLHAWLQTATRHEDLEPDTAQRAGRMALDLLNAALARARDGSSGTHAVLLLQVKAFLDRNLSDPTLTLDTVAKANAVSLRYLHLLFQGSGETAREYLRRRRLERAKQLLTSGGPAVSDVAGRCGFDSPSSFSRAYRAHYGMTPREARRED